MANAIIVLSVLITAIATAVIAWLTKTNISLSKSTLALAK